MKKVLTDFKPCYRADVRLHGLNWRGMQWDEAPLLHKKKEIKKWRLSTTAIKATRGSAYDWYTWRS